MFFSLEKDLLFKVLEVIIYFLAAGTKTFPNMVYRFVDVRDVALAHILALEVPSAGGRYCLVGSLTNNVGASKILRQLYPALNLPEM